MKKYFFRMILCLTALSAFLSTGCADREDSDVLVLRIANCEEYIDEGDWDEEEVIELDDGTVFGENALVDDFCEWYKSNCRSCPKQHSLSSPAKAPW